MALLLALAPSLSLAAEPAPGLDDPFPLRNQLPFHLLFLSAAPASARLLPPGRAGYALHLAYENTFVATDELVRRFARDDFATYDGRVTLPILESVAASTPGRTAFVLDSETLRAVLDFRLGVAPRLELGLEIPLLMHGGGFLDSAIDGYHRRFDLPDGGRTGFARDRFVAGYVGDGEEVFFDQAPGGAGLGDVVLTGRTSLLAAKGRPPAVAAAVTVKLPTGSASSLRGSGSTDYGASLLATQRMGRSTLHLGYGYAIHGDWAIARGVPLRDSRSLTGTYVFAAAPGTALLIQSFRTHGPFRYRVGSDLGRDAWEVAIGLRHRLPGDVMLGWAVIENIDSQYNTPDIGIFLGLSYQAESLLPPWR
jgi:Protein of unknown function (DUF3187)